LAVYTSNFEVAKLFEENKLNFGEVKKQQKQQQKKKLIIIIIKKKIQERILIIKIW